MLNPKDEKKIKEMLINREGFRVRVNPEQNMAIQTFCFEQGVAWSYSGKVFDHLEEPFLFIGNFTKDGLKYDIGFGGAGKVSEDFFKSNHLKEYILNDFWTEERIAKIIRSINNIT